MADIQKRYHREIAIIQLMFELSVCEGGVVQVIELAEVLHNEIETLKNEAVQRADERIDLLILQSKDR